MTAMGSVTIKIPLVTWRDGRPRFIPGAGLRALGYRGEDLRHGDGQWFDLAETIAWSKARQEEVAEKRRRVTAGETTPRRERNATQRAAAGLLTVGQLMEKWFEDPRMQGRATVEGKRRRPPLKPNTVRYYRNGKLLVERHNGGRVWHHPAAAVTPAAIVGIIARIEVESGLAQARCARATLSAAYSWARSQRLVRANPVEGGEGQLPVLPPRIRVGSVGEMQALVAAADAIGRADMGDAIMLGLYTGQRQNDRLALEAGQITDEGILFRQGKKHGQPLLIPLMPDLAARLAAARERRREWRVNWPHVVLDETTRRPFQPDWYRKVFRQVRAAAVNGVSLDAEASTEARASSRAPAGGPAGEAGGAAREAWKVPPTPSLADFRDQDLRDTAVTWLALADCNKWEIAAITGHSLKSIDDILKHYLGLHPQLARSAIGKLVKYLEAKG